MKREPLVSAVIIFLNAEKFIEEAIESVVAQTYAHWELLLVDDGSTDSSTAIAQRYVAQYPDKVRYLEHEAHQNKGMSASRNLGIRHARGEYVAFLDADDAWLPVKLEQQVAIMESQPKAAMVYGWTLIWYSWTGRSEDAGRDHFYELGVAPDSLIEPPALFFLLLENKVQTPTTCNALIRRSVFEEIGGFEDSFRGMYEDQAFFAKIHLRAPVFVAGECWAKYRQHSESCSLNTDINQDYYATRLPFLEWLENYLSQQNVQDHQVLKTLQWELWQSHHPRTANFINQVLSRLSQIFRTKFRSNGFGQRLNRIVTGLKPSKTLFYIFGPILLSLTVSAIVGLQLFQDGSSYLFELEVTRSAIRHHRLSVFLIQEPTKLLLELLTKLQADPIFILQVSRLIFNLSYALMPLTSLGLCWLVVRNRNESQLIWAALIILFINLVNFSWVSELLIGVQLACSLLLASILRPGSKFFRIYTIILSPIIFFLHPLVSLVFVTIALASGYVGVKKRETRKAAWLSATFFLAAAVLRGLLGLYALTPYEASFLKPEEMNSYLLMTSLENRLFLIISLVIGFNCLLAKSLIKLQQPIVPLLIISIQGIGVGVLLTNFNALSLHVQLLVTGVCIGIMIFYQYRSYVGQPPSDKLRSLYVSNIALAAIAGCLLVSQYFSEFGQFPLKTGLTVFASLLVMLVAAADSLRRISHFERILRLRLVIALSVIFSFVIISKSLIWQAATQRLEQALLATHYSCIELKSEDFLWLEREPYNIINNWALPSLALVLQDGYPRRLLLAEKDCKLYYETRVVQIDPWSRLHEKYIFPPLNLSH
jgi:glycosyltransferase involved in cell wall biosynthesis